MTDEVTTSADSGIPATDSKSTEATTDQTSQPTEKTTKAQDSQEKVEESFFDPKELSPELKAQWKKMHGAYTKRMQSFKDVENKAKIVDDFNRNPKAMLQQLAREHGLTIAEAKQAVSDAQDATAGFQPKTWDEVIQKARDEATTAAEQRLMEKFAPLIDQYKNVKQAQIEQTLDEEVPEWREYEDDMTTLLTEHPTLANDITKLARLAIPKEVYEGRAMQKALKKLEAKGEAAKVSKGTQTTKPVAAQRSIGSFQDAINAAKADLAA